MCAAREVRALAAASGLPAYHPKTHAGFFRYLLVRHSHTTGHTLFCLITTPALAHHQPTAAGVAVRDVIERMAETVMSRHPAVVSFYWGTTTRKADVALPEELMRLRGCDYLEDRLGPFQLRLTPLSFLQPTSAQADRLYTALAQALCRASGGVAWDLYCGLGLVGFYLSKQFQKIYGIDVEPHHVELARLNASLNGISNVEFRLGRVETLLTDRRFWLQEAKPAVIVVDPPRAGLHPKALSSLLAARPPYLAYLSCNVQSLIRDLTHLCGSFPPYRMIETQAFDMFPQTNHVEVFVLLERLRR
jgi:23S rRNA (uracil1939-C5)-methyltransferase